MAPVKEPVTESVEERSLVKKSLDGNIGAITLDNPPKHDALGAALIGELLLALSHLTNAGARATVLRAYKETLLVTGFWGLAKPIALLGTCLSPRGPHCLKR